MDGVVDLATEKRIRDADENADASMWTPRDVLVRLIRDIDEGRVKADSLVVSWLTKGENKTVSGGYLISTSSIFESVFMVEKLKQDLWADGIA